MYGYSAFPINTVLPVGQTGLSRCLAVLRTVRAYNVPLSALGVPCGVWCGVSFLCCTVL